METKQVNSILERYGGNRQYLIPILQDIQDECKYLPRDALLKVADGLSVPLTRVYAAATFYKAFSLEPRGEHLVQVCTGTACHVRASARVLESVERALGVPAGRTTPDGKFSLESVNCLGACALGPIVVVDGEYHSHVTPAKVAALFKRGKNQAEGRGKNAKTAKSKSS